MKKLIVFLLIIVFISITSFVKNSQNPLFYFNDVNRVCLVVDAGSLDGEVINCGNKDFVYYSKEDALEKINNSKIYAKQFYFDDVNLKEILSVLNADIVSTQEFEDLKIYYCYTPYEQDCVYIENKKVNLQIVFKSNEIVAGLPLILTGY